MDATGVWHDQEEESTESNDRKKSTSKQKKKKRNKYMRLEDDTYTGSEAHNNTRKTKTRKPILMTPGSPVRKNAHSMLENEDSADEENTVTEISLVSEDTLQTRFEAESPDELALVKAACYYGCKLLQRTPEFLQLWLPGST